MNLYVIEITYFKSEVKSFSCANTLVEDTVGSYIILKSEESNLFWCHLVLTKEGEAEISLRNSFEVS